MLLSNAYLLSFGALFYRSYCMEGTEGNFSEQSEDYMKLHNFNMDMTGGIVFDDETSLTTASTVVKDDYIRQNYRTVLKPELFETCLFKIAREIRYPRHLLQAMDILLQCEGLPVSWLDAGKVFLAVNRMPKELYQKFLAIVEPTGKFMTELIEHTSSPGNELHVDRLVAFLTWSYGKVPYKTWIWLLNDHMPMTVYGGSQLTCALVPLLVRDVTDLKDMIRTAEGCVFSQARPFLELILKTIHVFMFMTQDSLPEDFWLPDEIVSYILSIQSRLIHIIK